MRYFQQPSFINQHNTRFVIMSVVYFHLRHVDLMWHGTIITHLITSLWKDMP